MRECMKCGGNAYVDADPYCEHAFFEPPMPWCEEHMVKGERLYVAGGDIAGDTVMHPTREGAIALWQERALWGPAIAGLLGWLCAPSPGCEAVRPLARADDTTSSIDVPLERLREAARRSFPLITVNFAAPRFTVRDREEMLREAMRGGDAR